MFSQEVRYRFLHVNEDKTKLFEFLMTPGTQWEEIYAALDFFKGEFQKLQEEALKKESATSSATSDESSVTSQVVEAEVMPVQGE